MWRKQNPPHPCVLSSDLGEGVQGHQAPEFSVPQGSARAGIAFPSTGEKISFKNTPLLWFSIKAHQRATGCGSEWRQRDGEWKGGAGERSGNKLFSVQEGGEGQKPAIPRTHSPRFRIRYINRCSPPLRRQILLLPNPLPLPQPGPGCLGYLGISETDLGGGAGFKTSEGLWV